MKSLCASCTNMKAQQKVIYKVNIEEDKCKGCELCIFYCPVKHLKLSSQLNKRGVKFASTNEVNKCIGCGFCFLVCPDCCLEVYEK